jgi:hypothetical protein
MLDKRDECGCHRECTTLPHDCAHPCSWPSCLTEAEHEQLADEVMAELTGETVAAVARKRAEQATIPPPLPATMTEPTDFYDGPESPLRAVRLIPVDESEDVW